MRRTLQSLSPSACALIQLALGEFLARQEHAVEVCRRVEGPVRSAMEDSETYHAGRMLATTEALLDEIDEAQGIALTYEEKS